MKIELIKESVGDFVFYYILRNGQDVNGTITTNLELAESFFEDLSRDFIPSKKEVLKTIEL
jgi:hypothetical protein